MNIVNEDTGANGFDVNAIVKAHIRWLVRERGGKCADFSSQNLSKVNLSKTHLQKARFVGTDLSQSCLVGADLSEANFFCANMTDSDLEEAGSI